MAHTPRKNPVGRPPIADTPQHTHMARWLLDHPLISIRALELAAGIKSQGSLHKALRRTAPFPAKYYAALAAILAAYGYRAPRCRRTTSQA